MPICDLLKLSASASDPCLAMSSVSPDRAHSVKAARRNTTNSTVWACGTKANKLHTTYPLSQTKHCWSTCTNRKVACKKSEATHSGTFTGRCANCLCLIAALYETKQRPSSAVAPVKCQPASQPQDVWCLQLRQRIGRNRWPCQRSLPLRHCQCLPSECPYADLALSSKCNPHFFSSLLFLPPPQYSSFFPIILNKTKLFPWELDLCLWCDPSQRSYNTNEENLKRLEHFPLALLYGK